MEYFVSVDRKAYHDWQLELLVESFRSQGVQEKLFVGVNKTLDFRYPYLDHCLNHCNIYLYDDIGRKKGFSELNEAYQLLWLLFSKKLQSPIMVMKPHMVLRKHIENVLPEPNATAFLYAHDPFFTFDLATEKCEDFHKSIKKTKEFCAEKWFNLGNTFIMSGLPDWFVQKVINIAEELTISQIIKKKDVWKGTVRLAWVLATIDLSHDIDIFESPDLSSIMNDRKGTILIDYEHGLLPIFNKNMFTYQPPKHFSFGDPIEVASDLLQTPNSHHIAKLAKKIIQRRKDKIK